MYEVDCLNCLVTCDSKLTFWSNRIIVRTIQQTCMQPDYKDSDIRYIQAIMQIPDPVVTAVEIANLVNVSQQAAHRKLEDMNDRNLVRKKKVGSRAVIWWLTEEGNDVYRKELL